MLVNKFIRLDHTGGSGRLSPAILVVHLADPAKSCVNTHPRSWVGCPPPLLNFDPHEVCLLKLYICYRLAVRQSKFKQYDQFLDR